MRNLTLTLAVAAAMLSTAPLGERAEAAVWGAAAGVGTAAHTSPIEPAACWGRWGRLCPPGYHRVCRRFHIRCWCAPC